MKLNVITAIVAALLSTGTAYSAADCCKEGAECCEKHLDCCDHDKPEPKGEHNHQH
jgi:hypothetical protein